MEFLFQAEKLYNEKQRTGQNVTFVRNMTSSKLGPLNMTPNRILQPRDPNVMSQSHNGAAAGSSTCKPPAHGRRKQVTASKYTIHPYVGDSSRFNIPKIDRIYYNLVISMAIGEHSRSKAIRLHQEEFPNVTFLCLGRSLMSEGKIRNFVINACCRILFLENHPRASKRHYFFNTVGNHLLKSAKDFKASDVQYEFMQAHGVRTMQSCEMIYFPILHEGHWFLFVVDMKEQKFLFLDTLHPATSSYHTAIKDNIIGNFITTFSEHAKRYSTNFAAFVTEYHKPHMQAYDKDSGVYTMMYMEKWNPRVAIESVFDVNDMPNLRIILLNRMLRSKHNQEDLSVLHSTVMNNNNNCC